MVTSDPVMSSAITTQPMDPESQSWVRGLTSTGPEREATMTRLHELLLRVSTAEVQRRSARFRLFGPEVDDLAHQAAADATMAVCARIGSFRGESRFTTWAYSFAVFEASSKLGRHFWRDTGGSGEPDWEDLPAPFASGPGAAAEGTELLDAVRAGVEQVLTDRQRGIFSAVALCGVPLDAVVAQYGTNRNAVYKIMFDARRKLRAHLVAGGFLDREVPSAGAGEQARGATPTGNRLALDRFLRTDPRDVGCGRALEVLHLYAELVAAGAAATRGHPGVVEHLRACGPCGDDFRALLGAIAAR